MSRRRRVQRLSSLAPKNPRKGVAVEEHTRVQSEAPQAARLFLAETRSPRRMQSKGGD